MSQISPNFPTMKYFLAGGVLLALLLILGLPKFVEVARVEEKKTTKRAARQAERIEHDEQYKRETETLEFGMVFVQGGTFIMGCTLEDENACARDGRDKPTHQVTVSSFNICKYPVTQAQWETVMGNNPSKYKGDNHPADNISWNDAQEFISKLNELVGKQYRLPTEAEWEFAARGGNKSLGYKYSGSNSIDEVAWRTSNGTRPVGRKKQNELGIYEMGGNVIEWVNDWSGPYCSEAKTDPKGPSTGEWRLLRGASWDGTSRMYVVSSRLGHPPHLPRANQWGSYSGFRLAHD